MPKRCGTQSKRQRTIDSDSDLASDDESTNCLLAGLTAGPAPLPNNNEISITSGEDKDKEDINQWLLIHSLATKEEGCNLLTRSDLHFNIIDAKYNPLTRCFGVLIEDRDRLTEYAKVLTAILTGGLRVSTGRYVSPNDTHSISLTCLEGAAPNVSDDEFKHVVDHKYRVELDPDDFRIIFTSLRCWRVLLMNRDLTEWLVESGNIALAGEQLQVQKWWNDLDALDFPVYVNNIAHDVHCKGIWWYLAQKCNNEGMSVYWGQGWKQFKGVPISVTLPKSQEEQDEANRKHNEAQQQREAKKSEAHSRAARAEADRRKKQATQRSQQGTPKRGFTPCWGTSSSSSSSSALAPSPYTPYPQTDPSAGPLQPPSLNQGL